MKNRVVRKMNKQEKFEQIFDEIFPKVKAFAWKILQSEEDAEDIAQDVFAKLWNMPETWEDKETWHNYIYTIARNYIFNFLKHKAIEQKYQQQSKLEDYNYYSTDDIYDQLYAKELQLLVKLTIDRMPEQRRKVFLMSRQEEMSHTEIAERLGVSIRTVERHIYLALGELKKVLYLFFFMFTIE
ncbi:RNA polymerase sigma-70 factor [Bacteroides acidifaciens]|uniref:RNA polymerase sigma-70 factor n=2 Tax=Bacteroides acidifaciens TaxID=85831 RepID=UPI0023CD47A8|nr:RNA polymerase sigma-70 factor [Bacteroides acidifaciens]MDE6820164.1 RNA polymerase sigma-70 factor [Bacteroides acidifaciens]